jgi:cold shock CspA family protein/uncharacterized protein YbjQ (UPF0145 family)
MKGKVTIYLKEKSFGFIKGEDGNDYFFHKNSFNPKLEDKDIFSGLPVSFDPNLNKKGFNAKGCKVIGDFKSNKEKYKFPSEVLHSKSDRIKGYQVLSMPDYEISVTRRSNDEAFNEIKKLCQKLGGNAILSLKHERETRSKPGKGNGTYYYNVNVLTAVPALVGRREQVGFDLGDRIEKLESSCAKEVKALAEETKNRDTLRLIFVLISLFIILGAFASAQIFVSVVTLVLSLALFPRSIYKRIREIDKR